MLELSWMIGLPIGVVAYVAFRCVGLDGFISRSPVTTSRAE